MIGKSNAVVSVQEYIYVFTGDRKTFRLQIRKANSAWERMASRSKCSGVAVVIDGDFEIYLFEEMLCVMCTFIIFQRWSIISILITSALKASDITQNKISGRSLQVDPHVLLTPQSRFYKV